MEYAILYVFLLFVGFLVMGDDGRGSIKVVGVYRWFWKLNKSAAYALALPVLIPLTIIVTVFFPNLFRKKWHRRQ